MIPAALMITPSSQQLLENSADIQRQLQDTSEMKERFEAEQQMQKQKDDKMVKRLEELRLLVLAKETRKGQVAQAQKMLDRAMVEVKLAELTLKSAVIRLEMANEALANFTGPKRRLT